MFGRSFLLLVVIAAAVGVPYVSSEWPKLKAKIPFLGGSNDDSAGDLSSSGDLAKNRPGGPARTTTASFPADPHSEETPIVDMGDAFRFDVTPATVIARWPRVTTGLSDGQFQGLRVALITGMRYDDLAGALTYYFTPTQRCAKIAFSGSTGDPRRLTALLMERFGFKQFSSEEPGVVRYQIRWNGTAHSEMLIRPASVIRSSSPSARYEVQLSIVEPSAL